MTFNIKSWHNDSLEKIETSINNNLNIKSECTTLINAMRYSSLNGGKRIRPLFTIASANLSQAKETDALLIATAIELIHCFSLIHDDLPIMDNDSLRRGQPTNHIVYGDAVALLAGDALHTICFELLSSSDLQIPPEKQIKIIALISNAIGVHGMVCGQTIDWLSTGETLKLQNLEQMHKLKTGALIRASILAGYLSGTHYSHQQYDRLDNISQKIGLLFQIVDDIIDATEDSQTLGKTANKDAEQNKSTYVTLLGLAKAQEYAKKLHKESIDLIANEINSEALTYLANQIYYRNN